ncbi:MAG: alpha/beta hydrolase [Myxococcota bacterium]
MAGLRTRRYGTSGPWLVVLHGGPAAAGGAAALARGLADSFRVLEPWQRGSGDEPLAVTRHVADLHELLEARCGAAPPALVGTSWGAMLALAYAAEHPRRPGPIVLVGCGTFDPVARGRLQEILQERMKEGRQDEALYSFDPVAAEADETPPFDERAHTETWNDMVRLQEEGMYPAAFEAIRSPVLMLHGAYDPHPGQMIRDSLLPYLPQLEYREWERCGHYPWLERAVRGEFFAVLREWLARQL